MTSIRHFSVIGMWERNLGRDKLDVQYIVPTREAQNLPAYIALCAAHDISCREEEARASSWGGIKGKPQIFFRLVS